MSEQRAGGPNKPQFPFGGGKGPNLSGWKPPGGWRFTILYIVILIAALSFFNNLTSRAASPIIPLSEFRTKIEQGAINDVDITESYFIGRTIVARAQQDPSALSRVPAWLRPFVSMRQAAGANEVKNEWRSAAILTEGFIEFLNEQKVTYRMVPKSPLISVLLGWVVPILFFFFLWRVLMRRMGSLGGVLSVGQSKAVIVAEGGIKTRFADVAGVDEAKEELMEVVDFLKAPKKYTDIGGKIPRGVLLVGPPGTGKTLLARAVAGEAGVSFFRISGAEFVEMFVGVGAARVRDLFKQARERGRCIIFIDELDAIGKSRLNSIAGGNDEREQTLNQLLVEMDGFDAAAGIIVLAATNRPDVLDPALLRPGRFDRQVLVDRPDLKGREAILRIHAKPVKLDAAVDLHGIAKMTSGFSGADLANIVNEAALLAVRGGRKEAGQKDFEEAIEKTLAGLQKKTRVLKEEERRLTAYHEAGHALVAAFTPNSDPVQKISIIPRGFALGYTMQMPLEDRYMITQSDLLGRIDVLLGGRAAEELVSGEYSTGAANDLTKATDIARKMITDYGMSERFRNVALTRRGAGSIGREQQQSQEPVFQREYAESTQQYVDEEMARIMERELAKAQAILAKHRAVLDKTALLLLDKETIDEKEFKAILAEE
ncbi:MAG: ATP-dependent zinc metalloprotease FtsH [Treponema sp.]|jgi:cell division protease FtsH|nr:ATP-dependent zinc metalloprotease FtsH [Treponema sp.]